MTLRAFAAAAALLAGPAAGREPAALAMLDGAPVSVARPAGERALVVHFWATWCTSCASELPVVARAAAACAPQGVRVRIAAVDETPASVVAYQRAHALAFEALLDPRGRAWRAAGGFGLPANWVRSASGDRLLAGPRAPDAWRALLAELGCGFDPTSR